MILNFFFQLLTFFLLFFRDGAETENEKCKCFIFEKYFKKRTCCQDPKSKRGKISSWALAVSSLHFCCKFIFDILNDLLAFLKWSASSQPLGRHTSLLVLELKNDFTKLNSFLTESLEFWEFRISIHFLIFWIRAVPWYSHKLFIN